MTENAPDTPLAPFPPTDLAELERPELEALFAAQGQPRFRASQVFGWIYRRQIADPASMSDLPATLRTAMRTCHVSTPTIVSRARSDDGTEKFLLALADGQRVEADRKSTRLNSSHT